MGLHSGAAGFSLRFARLQIREHRFPPDGTLPDTDYRKWLATQPEPYRAKINASNNAFEIAGSVKSFESARQQAAAKAKADASRNKRIESAIQPRSAGGHSLGATDDDDFLAGFNSR